MSSFGAQSSVLSPNLFSSAILFLIRVIAVNKITVVTHAGHQLVPWVKGQSGNPNGRPRKFVTQMKGLGYKVSEINDTIQSLLALSIEELKAVKADESVTALERAVATALIKSGKSGDLKAIETLLSRVFGAPKQSFEGTIIEQPFFPDEPKKADTDGK